MKQRRPAINKYAFGARPQQYTTGHPDTTTEQGTGRQPDAAGNGTEQANPTQARPEPQDGAWWFLQLTSTLNRFVSLPDGGTLGAFVEQLNQYKAAVESGAVRPLNITRR